MKNLFWIFILCVAALPTAFGQKNTKPGKMVKEHVLLNVNAEAAKTLMYNQTDVVVLDVRTPEEFAAGSIQDAMNINYNAVDFSQQIDALDKSKTYLVYCRSGARSSKAVEIMKEKGFHFLYHLEGGYLAWPDKQVD